MRLIILFSVSPSSNCGPFANFTESYPYEIMEDASFFGFFIFSPAWVGLLLVALL